MKDKPLLPLITKLKTCPSHDRPVSRESFIECWDVLKREEVEHLAAPTKPIMAALILNDSRFSQLLDEPQNTQLTELVEIAIEKYREQTNPPNKLGRLIAGIINKEEET
jgi:hypothetical protein